MSDHGSRDLDSFAVNAYEDNHWQERGRARSNTNLMSTNRPKRPSLGHGQRSVSSPGQGYETARQRVSVSQSRRVQREWSLFGQVMENEAEVPAPAGRERSGTTGTTGSRTPKSTSRLQSRLPSMFSIHRLLGEEQAGPAMTRSTAPTIKSPSVNRDAMPSRSTASFYFTARTTEAPEGAANDGLSSDEEGEDDELPALRSGQSSTSTIVPPTGKPSWWSLSRFKLPVLYRNVLKCALAYLVASLFTFVPQLSELLSDIVSYGNGDGTPNPSGHYVATVYVFNAFATHLYVD